MVVTVCRSGAASQRSPRERRHREAHSAAPRSGAVLVFLVPALEASAFVGFFFPGEIAVLLGGVLAQQGKVPLWLVLVLGSLGSILGDSIGYEVGRRYGDAILQRLPRRLVKQEHLDRGKDLLRRRGGVAVFLGRFTVALRVMIPGLAGMSRLPYRSFVVFNIAGAVAWCFETALVGFVAGASYRAAQHRLSIISVALLGAMLGYLSFHLLRRSQRTRNLANRIDITQRIGRPLSLGLAVLSGAFMLFIGLIQDVTENDGLVALDPQVLRDLVAHRTTWPVGVAQWLTVLGSSWLLYLLLATAAVLAYRRDRQWRPGVASIVTLGAAELAHFAVANAVHRMRPDPSLWLTPADGFAFPSGHATTATVGYALLVGLSARPTWSRRRRILAAAVVAGLALSVGVSRAYLGVHWASDVLGGWTLGAGILALAFTLVQVRRRTAKPEPLSAV